MGAAPDHAQAVAASSPLLRGLCGRLLVAAAGAVQARREKVVKGDRVQMLLCLQTVSWLIVGDTGVGTQTLTEINYHARVFDDADT